ncbi:hypothetical protein GH714_032416 [Hevea brasiliensis]|uniref:DNA polymerase n=1 Tax=Hevea brasiliensis TaxID=3981 RepID=A0A6A6L6K2_HEVBR|nr:hypothetical protein GH714_032416 [Hevea brasiliensis]
MADEQSVAAGRRRSRGAEATARAEALERLKALRRGGRRSENGGGYDVKVETPIYDTVSEDDYDKLVARRREEAQGFIVDDDGLGYGDEGQEEDWSLAGLPPSSDESDGGEPNTRPKRKKTEKKEKETQQKKVNSSLSAAAAMMGKQRISAMFTSTVFKNKDSGKVKSLDCENIVDDVIAEFAPDEADRERRRRGQLTLKNFAPIKTEDQVLSNVDLAVTTELNRVITNNGDSLLSLGSDMEEWLEEVENLIEVKAEPVAKKEEGGHTLNAKITVEERDPALSAIADWQAVRSVGNGIVDSSTEELKSGSSSEEQSDFELEADGSLPFYIIDVHEEVFGANMGTLYLFGKVKAANTYHSCCVVVKNMQRCVYAIPNGSVFHTEEMIKLEKEAEESQISPSEYDVAYGLKNEIASQLLTLNVSSFSMAPVKRRYAFERSDIPTGENYVLKINYPFKEPPLPADLKGETFCALLGTHCSALELFLIKRKVKGPSWLSVSKFSICPASQRVSWCKFEITVDSPKDIRVSSSSKNTIEIPPMVVTAINLKTIINEKQNINEIVSASLICCHKAKIDSPMVASEWKKPGILSHFTVVRKLEGGIFPMGFSKEVTERNIKAGSNVLGIESSERALLNRLMIALNKLDSDVLVGHNISGFDLDVLLHRAQACRVPSSMWSKIGRLKRSVMPKLTKGNAMFGSGASPGIMSCIAGRLLCDTYLSSRDLLKEIECGETDAWLSMELMFHLSVLPLTRQLTNISGNLWGKTLQGARAQRVEYLLLHAFHAKKFMVPDKNSFHVKETKMTKRRLSHGVKERNAEELDIDHTNFDDDSPENDHAKGKKALPMLIAFSVHLHLSHLIDFTQLFYNIFMRINTPMILQEYNICFTTIEKSADGLVPRLPSSKTAGVLPELLKNLVERRRMVKSWMKNAAGLKVQQLDIQQQALKLTANSMYGCLGFSNSRFYAKPIAELITLQGREILQSTVDLVQNNLNLEVIYGDTDSIMIHSGLDDISKAKAIAGKVIQEVSTQNGNKKYRCLEIDLDGLYKRMLLLKKKKYAAVKLHFKDGTQYEVIERKGLDMVRRDWSLLSKELGDFCLAQILSGGSCEDVVESIHNSLMKVNLLQEDMRNGQVALEKYVITKTLTKPPEAYPDAKNQPHVLVALRLKQSGYSTGCSAGDTVPYIICCEQGAPSGNLTGIAQRARHPDELKMDDGKWMIDIDYYLSQQIHPVVSRLCASIQGTSPERLADCLGLDSSKFKSKSGEAVGNDPSSSLLFALNDEERYRSCEPLILSCPSCSSTFECPAIISSICMSISEKAIRQQVEESTFNFWHRLRCPNVQKKVKRQAEGFVSMYYKGLMMCDDETCKHTTRSLNMRLIGDSERGTVCPNYPRCNGRLVRKYTEADLYKQLSYFCHLLDTVRCMEKMDDNARIPVEKELTRIRPMVDLAVSTVQKIRDRCAYGWVQLNDLTVTV